MPTGTCGNCKKRACGRKHCPCGRVHYCDKECQTAHWYEGHRKYCFVGKTDEDGTMVMKFTRDEMGALPEGETGLLYRKKIVMLRDGSEIEIDIPRICNDSRREETLVTVCRPHYGDVLAVASTMYRKSDETHILVVTLCRSHNLQYVRDIHEEDGFLRAFVVYVESV
jgi:hypothetical protein